MVGDIETAIFGEVILRGLSERVMTLVSSFPANRSIAPGGVDVLSALIQRPVAVDLARRKTDETDSLRL